MKRFDPPRMTLEQALWMKALADEHAEKMRREHHHAHLTTAAYDATTPGWQHPWEEVLVVTEDGNVFGVQICFQSQGGYQRTIIWSEYGDPLEKLKGPPPAIPPRKSR